VSPEYQGNTTDKDGQTHASNNKHKQTPKQRQNNNQMQWNAEKAHYQPNND
jgi:hypothetical protein